MSALVSCLISPGEVVLCIKGRGGVSKTGREKSGGMGERSVGGSLHSSWRRSKAWVGDPGWEVLHSSSL
jgi:hypothetical protein